MNRQTRARSRTGYNFQMKSSSLYFLNDISNFNSTENLNTETSNWRDSYTFNPAILGRGHFSKVYKAKCSSSGKYIAIKVIRRRRLGVDKIDEIMKEIDVMQLLNKYQNPGFIQLLKHHVSMTEVAILLEFASGGAIYNVIRDSETGLPEIYTRIILSKVISALSIMHSHNIVHLDIKADNILLRHPYPSTDVAIADFGLARKLSKTKVHKEMIGTPDYIAPEVANYDSISTNSDMWSIGVLTYFILTNLSPFCADTKEETLNRVTKAQFEFVGQLQNENLHIARDFIRKLLLKIPEKRLSAEQCLLHDFLSSVGPMEHQSTNQIFDNVIQSIDISVNHDHLPHVRDNVNHKSRALVTSQYDFNSMFEKSNLRDPEIDLLKHNSVNCLLDEDQSRSSTDILNEEEKHTRFQPNDTKTEDINMRNKINDLVDACNLVLEETEEILSDDAEHKYSNVTQMMVDINNNDGEDLTNVTLECPIMIEEEPNEIKLDNQMSFVDPVEVSFDSITDITSSCYNMTQNMDVSIGSNSIKNEAIAINNELGVVKENGQISTLNHIRHSQTLNSNPFIRTKVSDSRRRIRDSVETSQLKSNSFRYSRDNLVETDFSADFQDEDISMNRNDISLDSNSREYNTIPLRHTTSAVKRRPLSRYLKRDCDKPPDTLNRRSQIIMNTEYISNELVYDANISKSHNTLNGAHIDNPKSNKPSSKFSFFKSKKPKTEENKSRNCVIS